MVLRMKTIYYSVNKSHKLLIHLYLNFHKTVLSILLKYLYIASKKVYNQQTAICKVSYCPTIVVSYGEPLRQGCIVDLDYNAAYPVLLDRLQINVGDICLDKSRPLSASDSFLLYMWQLKRVLRKIIYNAPSK